MTTTTDLLHDAFGRIREGVAGVLDGIAPAALTWRADDDANTVAWLVWHLTRVQDDHLAEAFGHGQTWLEEGWRDRFDLPLDPSDTGYGHSTADVATVRATAELLAGYHEAVVRRSEVDLASLDAADLERVVDERFDPPVTMAVRLVSVIADDLQHVGQAAYVRGLAERAGAR